MAYYPYGNTYNQPNSTYQMPTYQYTAPVTSSIQQPLELIRVNGVDGAKAYQMPPNSTVPLFDANNDIMYIKTTDGAGFPSIRAFTFSAIEEAQEPQTEYVPRPEFDKLVEQVRGLMENGKQPVSKPDAE